MKKNKKSSLYLQLLLSIIVIVCVVFYFMNNQNVFYLEFFLGLTLVTMGYNNKKFYHRENMTGLYFLVGLGLVIFSFIHFFGVQYGRLYLLQ